MCRSLGFANAWPTPIDLSSAFDGGPLCAVEKRSAEIGSLLHDRARTPTSEAKPPAIFFEEVKVVGYRRHGNTFLGSGGPIHLFESVCLGARYLSFGAALRIIEGSGEVRLILCMF